MKVINENDFDEYDYDESSIIPLSRIMNFAYDIIEEVAPDGPNNQDFYMKAIKELEEDFMFAIHELKSGILRN